MNPNTKPRTATLTVTDCKYFKYAALKDLLKNCWSPGIPLSIVDDICARVCRQQSVGVLVGRLFLVFFSFSFLFFWLVALMSSVYLAA